MDRKDFLSHVGMGAAGLLFLGCLGSCAKDSADTTVEPPPSTVDFTLDLTATANANLANAGGFVYSNGIIVAKTVAGTFIAVSKTCTHAGGTIQYVSSNDNFYCPNHGAQFSKTGAVISGDTNQALTAYKVSLSGTNLRVFS